MDATDTTHDRAVVLARILRTVDRLIADTKAIEQDRETLRRMTDTGDAQQEGRRDD